jgi:hypothetical protein
MVSGVMEQECATLLSEFFQKKRKKDSGTPLQD